ncbi:MAG: PTS sugar transporter subunit IIA [Elusimicrobia bacterium]|nr:PTS sugar transporter subunit IIA [Elusimicrobiota bacterium]
MVNILIITHGEFGAYLIEAAETIVGVQDRGVKAAAISPRMSVPDLKASLVSVLEELKSEDGLIILTDMVGGTPTNIIFPLVKDIPQVEILSGVNLYMLVVAFSHRATLGLEALTRKMLEDGQKSIRNIKTMLASQVK